MPEKIAVLSDIHGNSAALQAVCEDIDQIRPARKFVLGDLVAGLDPLGCVELLQSWSDVSYVRGNADLYLLTPDLNQLPERADPMHAELIRMMAWTTLHMRAGDLDWLRAMPDMLLWNGSWFAHATPIDRLFPERWRLPGVAEKYQEWFYHSQGIREDMAEEELTMLLACMRAQPASRLFVGHTHTPFLRRVGDMQICNVGSVGLPLDGDPRASWVLLEEMPDGDYEISIRRVAYDMNPILRLVDATPEYPGFERPGMQQAYRKMLETGLHWRVHLNDSRKES